MPGVGSCVVVKVIARANSISPVSFSVVFVTINAIAKSENTLS